MKVLFVCMGNICRSPTAQGVFEVLLEKEGLSDRVAVDSAGTGPWHVGKQPDSRAQEAAAKRGYRLDRQRARQVKVEDFSRFDLILPMDKDNLAELSKICPDSERHKVKLFLSYANDSDFLEVPDPYYGGQNGFELVLDLIEDAGSGLLRQIQQKLPK
ncbi:phosphotyrosine protein phosphatase [Hahella sp. CCB-MM4]|uniref:low molecular weight protein-tyrosine-phosphatase n=1 Tax=Hahella sp. (strain CCB-MM4) TaxID=1926491 RepID=UPI000B9AB45B|nr:low molecular weight protein-tyrosine-phosphatase [Hahella sp. CCB-MM4]OZG73452.1 phosphotyrosine protein phosphatase [Hahella sp. CCB-MM4]